MASRRDFPRSRPSRRSRASRPGPRAGQRGQGLVDYALILVLVAIVVIVVLTTMGQQIANVFRDLGTQLGRT